MLLVQCTARSHSSALAPTTTHTPPRRPAYPAPSSQSAGSGPRSSAWRGTLTPRAGLSSSSSSVLPLPSSPPPLLSSVHSSSPKGRAPSSGTPGASPAAQSAAAACAAAGGLSAARSSRVPRAAISGRSGPPSSAPGSRASSADDLVRSSSNHPFLWKRPIGSEPASSMSRSFTTRPFALLDCKSSILRSSLTTRAIKSTCTASDGT
mmetsp:Transcript_39405/g.61529  ORF Transcript_39405/g.61529 Transcript_39405/m.61529 type:complete len:207 (-) Transcript_39405:342-962(-)